jgi:hypothetical protein
MAEGRGSPASRRTDNERANGVAGLDEWRDRPGLA